MGDRGRAPLRRPGRDVVDLERAQPAAVPDAAVPQRPARTRRASTASSTRPASKGIKKTASNAGDTFLIGETSPRGNSKVVFPLDFFRRMLCLNVQYRKTKKCGVLDADGYAHHAYTTAKGPRFVPHDTRDVTLGVLSRLERALDRAGKAGALPRGLPVYLTEFGIQSAARPDPGRLASPSRRRTSSIAEHMAYVNPRVRSFSQYLMTDDRPRASALNKYAGFESGLRTSKGKKKPAYKALPAAARGRELRRHRRPVGPRAPVARRRPRSRSRSTRAASAAGASSTTSRRRAPASTRCARRTARASATASSGPRRAASATPARPCARTERLDIRRAWPFVRLGS